MVGRVLGRGGQQVRRDVTGPVLKNVTRIPEKLWGAAQVVQGAGRSGAYPEHGQGGEGGERGARHRIVCLLVPLMRGTLWGRCGRLVISPD